MDLEALKAIRRQLGGTVNDVMLAIVAGALRKFLRHRGAGVTATADAAPRASAIGA